MPTVTIRLSDSEKADLQSRAYATDQSVSDYVRETLSLRVLEPIMERRLTDVEERLARLEDLAERS